MSENQVKVTWRSDCILDGQFGEEVDLTDDRESWITIKGRDQKENRRLTQLILDALNAEERRKEEKLRNVYGDMAEAAKKSVNDGGKKERQTAKNRVLGMGYGSKD